MGFRLGNSSVRIGRRRQPSGCLVLIMGVIFLAISFFFFKVIVPDTERDSSAVENSFAATLAEFEAIDNGEDVVVTGEFVDNEPISGDAIAVHKDQLLRLENKDGNVEWRWQNLEREQPILTFQIDGGTVRTAAGGVFTWRGGGFEVIEAGPPADTPERYTYAGQSLTEGAIRTSTLHNGDHVTLLGAKTESGAIRIRDLYNGEREGLAEEVAQSNQIVKLVGYVFGGAGLLALLGGVLSILRGRIF